MAAFTYSVKTMGCKANTYDSLILEQQLAELGGVRDEKKPDVFILNSCTVTAEADKQCQKELNQIKKRSPDTFTVLTGCYAQVGAKEIAENTALASKIGLVIDNDGKNRLRQAVAERFGIPITSAEPDPEIYWGELPTTAGRTRSFVKIQEGCNDYCTYCIIPYARGKSRSVRMSTVLSEIQRLALLGVQEVVLTGTNIADYGKDQGMALEDLVEAILEHTALKRLRLTSLDPTEITERVLRAMSYEGPRGARLMPHLHVSLQSPVSRVLRAMKRQYRTEEVIDALTRVRALDPSIYVGMDVITGFPSETDEEHAEAVKILRELPWTRLHVFPYSERAGTPATRIRDSVPVARRKERAQELLNLSRERHEAFIRRFIGQQVDGVLFEAWHEGAQGAWITGHAPNYIRVAATAGNGSHEANEALKNTVGSVRVTGAIPKPAQDWTLTAEIL